ncbi:MAG: dephospho-CoA kinase [Boseongicola sp.]
MRPYVIGLTGSIGMGKTTTAKLFADEGVPVWSADDAVHRIYSKGGAAVPSVNKLCPDAVIDGAIDRAALSDWIVAEPDRLRQIEEVVHPFVAADRQSFIDGLSARIVLVDVPLLFETGADRYVDAVIVVTAPAEEQRRRVLERAGMTAAKLDMILAKQLPDAEKRARADFVVEATSLESARKAVQDVLGQVKDGLNHA